MVTTRTWRTSEGPVAIREAPFRSNQSHVDVLGGLRNVVRRSGHVNQGDRIRTCDLRLPKPPLYQAELRPVRAEIVR